jgi:hypothetical protein
LICLILTNPYLVEKTRKKCFPDLNTELFFYEMDQVLPDYDSDEEDSGGEKRPRQSPFFFRYRDTIVRVRDRTGWAALALFGVVIIMTSWINLEEGRFPFNISGLADMAYTRGQPGTPGLALLLVASVGLVVLTVRIFALEHVDTTAASLTSNVLGSQGMLVPVRPKPPKSEKVDEK